ncbi:hypothetical protein IFM89_017949 [Coptis chinensis]|uniref:WAT1-related protein n=1 Tax=Coptis chinensis TaxID=261450 RepID=A0A835LZX0_9MAGN|nr:hypothetical protein IFM89_017949 [Coptis chinensis]
MRDHMDVHKSDTSSPDGSEPIYEGEDRILHSGLLSYQNQEPMYEGEGKLYLLATDQGFINQPDLVWEYLNESWAMGCTQLEEDIRVVLVIEIDIKGGFKHQIRLLLLKKYVRSIYHLRLGFSYLASRPYTSKWYLWLVIIQTIYASMFLLSTVALDGGMNSFVFVFYRQAFATIFLVPFAFMFERDKAPPLSFIAFSKMFMLSLFGITICLNVYGIALVYTFAMLAAGTANTLHVITFLMAVLLR